MTPSSVLVIKPSSLGDIVHTLPAVHFLKTTFRDADFYWSARSAKGRRILGLSDAREAAGYHYHERVDVDASQHSVDRYVQLARFAGADTSGPACFPLPRGRAIPSLELPDRFIVLHPFARGHAKSLTSEEIFEFTRLLAPHPVFIVGRSEEYFTVSRNAISLVNQTDLLQLIWLLRGRVSSSVSIAVPCIWPRLSPRTFSQFIRGPIPGGSDPITRTPGFGKTNASNGSEQSQTRSARNDHAGVQTSFNSPSLYTDGCCNEIASRYWMRYAIVRCRLGSR
jgi:hypothetical protein